MIPMVDVLWRRDLQLADFWETYNYILNDYIYINEVEKKVLEQWAVKWLVDALWDIHSEYLNPQETEQFNNMLSGDFEWIGAVVDKVDLGIIVERVLKGSPAKEFWVRKWDIILEANGEELQDLGLYEAVEKIKGPASSSVDLKILRAGESDILEIRVIRQKIVIPSVEAEAYEESKDYYISLNKFWDNSSEEFLEELRKAEGYEGLIIDLRDNWGGYLQSAVEMLSEFIEDGKILVTTKYRDNQNNFSYKSRNDWEVFDKRMVVLINGNSASAAEILAGALSDYNKAILIWEKSYGKGSVQQPYSFENGALLKLTIAKWLTPKGHHIDKEWLEPDLEVLFEEEDYDDNYDRQLEEAKKLLQFYKSSGTRGEALDMYKDSVERETLEK